MPVNILYLKKLSYFLTIFILILIHIFLKRLDLINFEYKIEFILTFIFYLSVTFISIRIIFDHEIMFKFMKRNKIKILLISFIVNLLIILSIKIYSFDYINIYTLSGLNEHRATHWLTNFQNYGFIKRSLVGTVYHFIFGNPPSYFNILVISYFVLISKIIIILYFSIDLLKRFYSNSNFVFVILFFTTPYFINFYLTDIGRLDQINNLILLMITIIILKNKLNYFLSITIGLLCVIGILVHEAFILIQIPYLIFIILMDFLNRNKLKDLNYISNFLIILLIMITGVYINFKFGYPTHISFDEMKILLEDYDSFIPRLDLIETFFADPIKNLNISRHWASTFNILNDYRAGPYLLIDFLLLNLPCIGLGIFILFKHLKQNKDKFFNLNYLILIFLLSQILIRFSITYIDFYRVFAYLILFIFLTNYYFYNFNSKIDTDLSEIYSFRLIYYGVFYNFALTGITVITAFGVGSPSIYLYIFDKIFFK